ncbi:MAG: hypothetical protein H0X51_06525 [Parachlamydiaceae bacterium]|nr:hypothetical protein [Parachlamydiaceae bacterium]
MNAAYIDTILSAVQAPLDEPRFYERVFSAVTREQRSARARDGDNLKRVCAEEYDDLSRRLDYTLIQESVAVRNVLRTRRLANLLISDKGEVNSTVLGHVITQLKANMYSLGPNRQHDSRRHAHIIKVLTLLSNKELILLLKRIGKPHAHPQADQIIRDTLQLPQNTTVTDAHTRRAVLAAWLCFLRQSVGSCFATAPAIIVHDEQPELFLTDLQELLTTGRLKRTFGGVEYSVPLSVSWGAGDLRKTVLLSKDGADNDIAFWYSPGLLYALESVALIDKEAQGKDKVSLAQSLIEKSFPEWNDRHPYVLTSAEEVLKKILMQHQHITQQDLDDYAHRPQGMIHTSLLIQVSPVGSGMGGKGEACATFYNLLEKASNAFKALADNALLKAWEFTLASFSETKSEFTRWNLYSSLGLGPDDPGGIGQCLFNVLKQKLDQTNQKVKDLQIEYEQVYAHLKMLESRMRHTDKDSSWVQAEYQSKVNEFHTFEEVRNKAHAKAELFANLFDMLITKYDQLFPMYFQEVYDADLHEVTVGPYDDSPAGFRLLYKHGRGNTAQWSKIKTPDEFVDALSKFFISTESEIDALAGVEKIKEDLSDIITAITTHVRSKEFLESAFYRMAKAHNTPAIAHPLENLNKIAIKPWAYTSGGTMGTLVSSYYRREQKPTEVARWVENPMELFVFFVDTLKKIPYKSMEDFLKEPNKSMLMHSPTHAFLLKPGFQHFRETWQNEAFTYTWLRDNFVHKGERFLNNIGLDQYSLDWLIERLTLSVPHNYRPYFKKTFSRLHGPMAPYDFRDYLENTMEQERGLHYQGQPVLPTEEIDRLLYTSLPFFPKAQLKERLDAIFGKLNLSPTLISSLSEIWEKSSSRYIQSAVFSANDLLNIALAFLTIAYGQTSLSVDYHQAVFQAAQELGYTLPKAVLFADTNWTKDFFAFLVSPGTGMLELWRTDALGREAAPMASWKQWLNGTRKEAMWGLYAAPYEYTPALPQYNPTNRPISRLM